MIAPTLDELRSWREAVSARLARAEKTGDGDPIANRLDEYRGCIAELDEWIDEVAS